MQETSDALPPGALGRLPDGTPYFAPLGCLTSQDDGVTVVCHLCGRELAMLAGSHLKGHLWTPEAYREAFGLKRTQPLLAPAVVEQRRAEGARRYAANPRLRQGMATGQAMARDGRLLALAHEVMRPGTARLQARLGAAQRTEPTRQRTAEQAAARLSARLVELGHPGDLAGYLHDRYVGQGWPVLRVARELGVGNVRIKGMLDAAAVPRRPPGGDSEARRGRRSAGRTGIEHG